MRGEPPVYDEIRKAVKNILERLQGNEKALSAADAEQLGAAFRSIAETTVGMSALKRPNQE